MTHMNRRDLLGLVGAVGVGSLWPLDPPSPRLRRASPPQSVAGNFPAQNVDAVREVVGASHSDLARVKELVTRQPSLAKAAWDFYDGTQWTREEVDALSEHGQPAIVINRIAAKVDNLAGTEVAGRTRVVYRSRSGASGEEDTARVLTDLALYVAERNDQALEVSGMFKAGLCKIVSLNITQIKYPRERPRICDCFDVSKGCPVGDVFLFIP